MDTLVRYKVRNCESAGIYREILKWEPYNLAFKHRHAYHSLGKFFDPSFVVVAVV